MLARLLASTHRESEGRGESETEESEEDRGESVGTGTAVPALPVQLFQRNRLTNDQIKQLPRFHDYSPGQPSSVCEGCGLLYMIVWLVAGALYQEPSSQGHRGRSLCHIWSLAGRGMA